MEQEFQPAAPPGARVADRAADLLVRVLDSDGPVALGDLAAAAGLPKSTASRLVGALERHGLVGQDGARGRLEPGPAILRFAHRGAVDRTLVELSQESLDALAAVSGETINLAVPSRRGVEHVAQVDSRHFLGTGQWLDRVVDYHSSANGKIFLAFGAAELPRGPLAAATPRTLVDPAKLAAELERVRREGFATVVDELELGLTALAAPVRDQGRRVVAALSISGPSLRLAPRRVAELRPILIREARALSRALGHRDEGEQAA